MLRRKLLIGSLMLLGTFQPFARAATAQEARRPAAPSRIALVIGNDRYVHVPALRLAGNDARAVGDRLGALGFNVTRLENATHAKTEETLDALTKSIRPDDTVVVYFAGQSTHAAGRDFLHPVDLPYPSGPDALLTSLPVDRLVERIRPKGDGRLLVVVDGCRDNPLKLAPAASNAVLPAADTWNNVFLMFSAGAGQPAFENYKPDDPDPNSVFTRSFIKALGEPDLTAVDLALRLRQEVMQLTDGRQLPAYYDQLKKALILNPKSSP